MAKKAITVEKDKVYVNGNLVRNRPDYDAKDDFYNNVAEYFATGKTGGNSHLANIMQKVFTTADKNVDKSSTMALQTMKLYNELMINTTEYIESKKKLDKEFTEFMLRKRLFPWQQTVFDDISDRKLLVCGRRTGKTYMEAYELLKHTLIGYDIATVGNQVVKRPRCAIFIGMTIGRAKELIWDALKELIAICRIPVAKIDNSELRVTFGNGAFVQLGGNSNKREREKIRGDDWSMAIIDECQSHDSLKYLLDVILGPIIAPRHGTIILSGTGPLIKGYWSNCIEGVIPGWKVFHYTMKDNPLVTDWEEQLEKESAKFALGKDDPAFRREWLGEIAWDTNLLIYPKIEYYTEIPKNFRPVKAFIGVDDGLVDGTAVCLMLVDEDRNGYVSDEFFKVGCSPTELENTLKAFNSVAKTKWNVQEVKIVADNHGKQMYQDFQNHGINNIEMAIKTDKNIHIAYLNEALASGRLKCKKDGFINDEAIQVCWKYDTENDRIVYEEDKKKYHQNMMDSLLYAWTNYEMNN